MKAFSSGTCVHLERYEEKMKLKEMIGDDDEEDDGDKRKRKKKGSDEEDFDGDAVEDEEDPEEMEVDADEDDDEDDDDEDDSKPQKRSKRERKQTKAFEGESSARSSKRGSRIPSEDDESDYGNKKRRKKEKPRIQAKKKKKKKKPEPDSGSDDNFRSSVKVERKKAKKVHKGATTGRERAQVSYAHSDSHSHESDRFSGYETPEEEKEKVDVPWIDFVMDHRDGKVGATGEKTRMLTVKEHGDPNETLETTDMEKQFQIKWKGKGHIDNTWETPKTIEAMKVGIFEVKGQRKVINYELKLSDYLRWKKRADKEEVEYQECEIEQGRMLARTYSECERIFSRRKVKHFEKQSLISTFPGGDRRGRGNL